MPPWPPATALHRSIRRPGSHSPRAPSIRSCRLRPSVLHG
uniref:Uncharacterized protein n=1 Tax=Arundo donax TaxID=35708 RepID=A0A0A8Z8T9_ARUDO